LTSEWVRESFQQYCYTLASLHEETNQLVLNIMENPPTERPYEELKERLLQSHSLDLHQSFKKLTAVPALGGQQPSMLMAAMKEIYPRGE
jgi:hypothetical protein